MEREKKRPDLQQQGDRSQPGAARGTASLVSEPVGGVKGPAMVMIADAIFDMHMDEKQHGRSSHAPSALVAVPGIERLVGILGPCVIPGCDVHILSPEKAVGRLEGGGFGVGFRIVKHLETSSQIEPALSHARDYWSSPHPAAVAVLVYTDRASVLMVDGTEVPLR